MAQTKKTPTKSKTLVDFRAAHDPDVKIPAKIAAGLKSLLAEGREAWEYNDDFRNRCGVSPVQFERYASKFEQHMVLTKTDNSSKPKRVWFADPKIATQARGE